MSYTHYWFTNIGVDRETWARAFSAVAAITSAHPVALAGPGGTGDPEMGEARIAFNGAAPRAGEACVFYANAAVARNPRGSRRAQDWWFDFCATHHEPYDVVVTAALAAVQEIVGTDGFLVTSDGNEDQWRPGCDFASRVLGREISIPPAIAEPGAFDSHPSQE
jgi:hypothetical protein